MSAAMPSAAEDPQTRSTRASSGAQGVVGAAPAVSSSTAVSEQSRDAEILDQAAVGLSPLLAVAPAHPQPPSPDDDVEKQESPVSSPTDGKTVDGLTDQTNRLPTRTVLLIFFGVGSAVMLSFLDQTGSRLAHAALC